MAGYRKRGESSGVRAGGRTIDDIPESDAKTYTGSATPERVRAPSREEQREGRGCGPWDQED